MGCYTIGAHYSYFDLPPKPLVGWGAKPLIISKNTLYYLKNMSAKACLINLGHLKTKVREGVVSGHPVQATRLYQLITYLSPEKIISSLVHLDRYQDSFIFSNSGHY